MHNTSLFIFIAVPLRQLLHDLFNFFKVYSSQQILPESTVSNTLTLNPIALAVEILEILSGHLPFQFLYKNY